jgi:hypothetical protein
MKTDFIKSPLSLILGVIFSQTIQYTTLTYNTPYRATGGEIEGKYIYNVFDINLYKPKIIKIIPTIPIILKEEPKIVEKTVEELIEELIIEKFGKDSKTALRIAKCESGLNPNAYNKSGASGIFQIIPKWHKDKIKGRNIFDKEVNIEVAYEIFKSSGWNPWTCK